MKFTPLVLLAMLAVWLGGCSSSSRIIATGLSIELTAVQPQADGSVKVTWHVANTNIVSYLLSEVQHKITLNGAALGTLEEHEPLAVPANTNAGRTSVVKASPQALQLLQAAGTGPVRYQVDSKITILIYGDTTEVSKLSNSGSVPVTR